MYHQAGRYDGKVRAFAAHGSFAEFERVRLLRHLFFIAFEGQKWESGQQFVPENYHRIWIAQRGDRKSLRVEGGGWNHDFEAWRMGEKPVEHLRMLPGVAVTAADRGQDRHRHGELSARHVVVFGHVVVHLVEASSEKVDEHQRDHRMKTCGSRADRHPHEGLLGYGSIDYSVAPVFLMQPHGEAKHGTPVGDVLAEHDDITVFSHLLVDGFSYSKSDAT